MAREIVKPALDTEDKEEVVQTCLSSNGSPTDSDLLGTLPHETLWPCPSRDPNDPLNWSRKAKIASLLSVSVFAFLANVNSNCLLPALRPIAQEFHVSPQMTSFLIPLNVLMLGVGNLFWVPFMRKFGKRAMFLTACSIVVIINICSPFAKSYGGLLAARMVSNFCAGSADATVPSFVGEVFFLHERGACMMIFHIFLSGAFFLGPFICGWITRSGGWRWTLGFMAIATFVDLVAIFFLFRESAFERDLSDEGPFEKRSYRQWLGVSLGYRRDINPLRVFYEIVRLAVYPPILWAGFQIGVISGSNVILQLVCGVFLAAPPYSFNPGEVGSFQVAGFVGAVFGFFLGGRLIDNIAAFSTRRNGGVHEPEMRLPALIIPAICGPVSMIVSGLCFRYHTAWIGPAVGLALTGLTITCVNNIGVTYAVDSYLSISGEVITVVFVIRNTISCLLALYSNTWVTNTGVAQALGGMAGIEVFFFAAGLMLYYYGKRLRLFTSTYGPLREMVDRRHHVQQSGQLLTQSLSSLPSKGTAA